MGSCRDGPIVHFHANTENLTPVRFGTRMCMFLPIWKCWLAEHLKKRTLHSLFCPFLLLLHLFALPHLILSVFAPNKLSLQTRTLTCRKACLYWCFSQWEEGRPLHMFLQLLVHIQMVQCLTNHPSWLPDSPFFHLVMGWGWVGGMHWKIDCQKEQHFIMNQPTYAASQPKRGWNDLNLFLATSFVV